MNDCPPLPPSGEAKGVQLDRAMTTEEVHEVDDPTGGVSLSDTDSDDAEAVEWMTLTQNKKYQCLT